ncbi:MAG: hypothetical protein JNK56_11960 [Myxococcales bacterium]|nr:hypothetical protein [Myxococcales bacterium]
MPRPLRVHLACLFATACGPTPGDTDDPAPWTLVDANVSISPGDPWQQVLLTWDNFYGDYGGPAALDLRIRRFTSATVVLAGMYSDDWSAALDEIVASTCWTPGTGECCPDE